MAGCGRDADVLPGIPQETSSSAATPYQSSHAICVRERAQSVELAEAEIPARIKTRLFSVREFDQKNMIVDTVLIEGTGLSSVIDQFFGDENVSYLHLRDARQGCNVAQVDRRKSYYRPIATPSLRGSAAPINWPSLINIACNPEFNGVTSTA